MAVSYKRLFKLLIDRDMKKKDLCELAGVSPATITKLSNGENVTMEVIEKICMNLNCSADDILEIIPDCSSNGADSVVKKAR
jgi:DNA-binding Xre family transcriptional regulator